MDYSDQLKNGLWQKRRLEIFNRDNFECQASDCIDRKNNIQVHHLYYLSPHKAWEYPNNMLITLCAKCHENENLRYNFESSLLQVLRNNGFLVSDIISLTTALYENKKISSDLLTHIRNLKNG